MKLRLSAVLIILALIGCYLFGRREPRFGSHAERFAAVSVEATERLSTNNDIVIGANDSRFSDRVLPAVSRFFEQLNHIGVDPFHGRFSSGPFSKIRMIEIPNGGVVCRFVIADSWTVTYADGPRFSGVLHFGQRGP